MDKEALSMLFQYLVFEKYLTSYKNKPETMTEKDEKEALVDVVAPDVRRKLRILYDILEMPKGDNINIFAEGGTEVIHNGQIPSFDKNLEDNARTNLSDGSAYTIKTCLPLENYTMVEIQEFPGILFDSAVFTPADKTIKDDDALLAEYGSDLDGDMAEARIWKEALEQAAE